MKTDKPSKLQPAKSADEYPWVGSVGGGGISGDGLAATNATMALLARRLSPALGRPVIDRTGIEGTFDFKVPYHPGDPDPDVISCILVSVQPLGLKLETGRGPVETLVIDHVEKPTAN